METKDITRHVMWALVISVGWWLITWLLGMLGAVGMYLKPILALVFVYGLLFYAINVKGIVNGLLVGLIYAAVFLTVHIIIVILLKNPLPNGEMISFFGRGEYKVVNDTVGTWTVTNPGDWKAFFDWPNGIYFPLIGFIVFSSFIGWSNERK